MNANQIKGSIREIVYMVAILAASFGWIPEEYAGELVPLGTALAMVAWGFMDRSSKLLPSFFRKLLQSIPPVLALYGVITPEQSGIISSLVMGVALTWTNMEKNE